VIDEESSNVSAGEKQLITIARAFLAEPAVLILDEATSSVNSSTCFSESSGLSTPLLSGRCEQLHVLGGKFVLIVRRRRCLRAPRGS
jgi:predicted ABC-type transport system involved in lysophospholipase L1 biosynthesis ATPase subunit